MRDEGHHYENVREIQFFEGRETILKAFFASLIIGMESIWKFGTNTLEFIKKKIMEAFKHHH